MMTSAPTAQSLRIVAAWHRKEAQNSAHWEHTERLRHGQEAKKLDLQAKEMEK